MPDYYYFFFSYARDNHNNARWNKPGISGNHLDEFYDVLCREVSDLTGRPADQVAYRDQHRLKVSDFWRQELLDGLQKSRVLLSMISPHYLKSHNCGRELAFFNKRLEEYVKVNGESDQQSHRIMPVFWEDSTQCLRTAKPEVTGFLKQCNFTQKGMPANYPSLCVTQICKLRPGNDYEQLCRSLAERIVELSDNYDPLPKLMGPGDFSDLPSLYTELEAAHEELILNGLAGANVIYLVGTRAQIESIGASQVDRYEEDSERWRPFPQAPGATIDLLTREGAFLAGINDLRNLGMPDNLIRLIEVAKQKNSPVLLVLDRCALSISEIKTRMREYDGRNFDNCGLVTAGGIEVTDDAVREVFKFKCIPNYLHHIWDVPTTRDVYVESVASVLGGIKKQLMHQGTLGTTFNRRSIPGLPAPSGA